MPKTIVITILLISVALLGPEVSKLRVNLTKCQQNHSHSMRIMRVKLEEKDSLLRLYTEPSERMKLWMKRIK